jgi:hypothetical protein
MSDLFLERLEDSLEKTEADDYYFVNVAQNIISKYKNDNEVSAGDLFKTFNDIVLEEDIEDITKIWVYLVIHVLYLQLAKTSGNEELKDDSQHKIRCIIAVLSKLVEN